MPDNRIKILYVIDKMVRAGAQNNLYQLNACLDRKEFQPMLCCLLYRGPLADGLEGRGIKVESLELKNIMGFRFIRALLALSRLVRREEIDLIHSYLFAANIVAPWAGFFSGVPVITSRRDTGFWKRPYHILAHRLCNLLTERITVNSGAVMDYVLRRERARPSKISLIRNGLALAGLSRLASGKSFTGGKVILGCLGNIRPVKGYEYLFAALEKLNSDYELRIGGRVLDQDYYRRLREEIANSSLRGKVVFSGEIDAAPDFLSKLHVFILPSLSEGFSNALLEAMSAGLAVVATDVGGARELITDGKDGFLVSPRDAPGLSRRIARLIAEPGLIGRLGRGARRKVAREFDVSRMCLQIQDLYRRVVG
jgi:glycosyltransferase involved in cell wall biosynthesis